MKIYTKTGDDGTTALFGGSRVRKNDRRVEAYGSIDELNSFLGLLISKLSDKSLISYLQNIQHILFNLGSVVATIDPKFRSKLPSLDKNDIHSLESQIDELEKGLSPMLQFILPGGSEAVSTAHICRTVCRRVERNLVSLLDEESVDEGVEFSIRFINRLSDFFFVLARTIAKIEGLEDVTWSKEVKL